MAEERISETKRSFASHRNNPPRLPGILKKRLQKNSCPKEFRWNSFPSRPKEPQVIPPRIVMPPVREWTIPRVWRISDVLSSPRGF